MRWWSQVDHVIVATIFLLSGAYWALIQSPFPWFLKVAGVIAIGGLQFGLAEFDSRRIELRRKAISEMIDDDSDPIYEEVA
jgi:hypothetical protein